MSIITRLFQYLLKKTNRKELFGYKILYKFEPLNGFIRTYDYVQLNDRAIPQDVQARYKLSTRTIGRAIRFKGGLVTVEFGNVTVFGDRKLRLVVDRTDLQKVVKRPYLASANISPRARELRSK